MNSPEARAKLVEALRLDLVGPWPGHEFSSELLPENPTRWYLTGYLVPESAPVEHRSDAEAKDEIDAGGEGGGMDDGGTPDKAAPPSLLPSSMGLSVLVPSGVTKLHAEVSWGDYHWEDPTKEEEPADEGLGLKEEIKPDSYEIPESSAAALQEEPSKDAKAAPPPKGYRRSARSEPVEVSLPEANGKPAVFPVPNSRGLRLVATARPISQDSHSRLPKDTRAVCVFVVNGRPPADHAYQANAFQAQLRIKCEAGFVPRPDLRGGDDGMRAHDWDEQVADLQYRRAFDFVSGIGCAAEPVDRVQGGQCHTVQTCWIPSSEVEFVGHLDAAALPGVELGMEALASLGGVEEARAKLGKLVEHYRGWIDLQASEVAAETSLESNRQKSAKELVRRARLAADRMAAGIELLAHDDVREAFCTANRTMARQARQREAQKANTTPELVSTPTWRAFQLGFILLNLRGLHDPLHADRQLVDLLFFPTGGGKTEAYLGLAAFSLVIRRLRNPGRRGAGVNVLMRYTLRLLTLDQLSRASALICALELERQERTARGDARLGDWPFEIGLWVGSAATPNRMGGPGYKGPSPETTAYRRCRAFRSNSKANPSPIPLENCPWCGKKFDTQSFRLIPSEQNPQDLRITCVNPSCVFTGDHPLPIVAVDEPIYRRLPGFLIATVDKFAALPWIGPSGKLFGHVERVDNDGFYNAAEPGRGQALGGPLLPPELIIQDELHLISGPLGTIAGVYETAIGHLAERDLGEGRRLRPKIIASTATVRQAETQIRGLFARPHSMVFPPAGPNRRDSFFSKTQTADQTPARLYLGVGAQGRSLKVVLLRTALALLSAGQTLYKQAGGKSHSNPVDPYMTLLGYFNSLRELGGSRRIVEDEVTSQLRRYKSRKRRDPVDGLFSKREIGEPLELTSRVSTNQVSEAKRRLAQTFAEDDHVDIALATNMISVGLDITRLGLMVVLGQPKMCAEYIQATSRVGRDPARPGLVVTLLNVHKPRDRSHYEHFGFYHETFYRTVEATSVTPFSPRALDRALAAALVAFARHHAADFGSAIGATNILTNRPALDAVAEAFAERAVSHRFLTPQEQVALRGRVRDRCIDLLDTWYKLADIERLKGAQMQYGTELPNQPALLHGFLDEALAALPDDYWKFRANRSMRDVEPSVHLFPQILKG
ncbi:MAG TPA: DISARM system helicase DrmA [Verrucomicrobiae bacterium]|nr:DISARM system helicase DrmA [Verrucomicrobiae bacterium]